MSWTWIIGDVHGRDQLLRALLAAIGGDAPVPPTLVFVGDLIDHGPGAAAVLRLVVVERAGSAATLVLPGNHEMAIHRFLFGSRTERSGALRTWLGKGGAATLASLGVEPPSAKTLRKKAQIELLREATLAALDPFARHWLEHALAIPLWHDVDAGFRVVHAGFRPGVPTARQRPADLLDIREPFLSSGKLWDGRVVVHGHTRLKEPRIEVHPARINVDVGAARGEALGAVAVEGDKVVDAIVVTADGGERRGVEAMRVAQDGPAAALVARPSAASASARITAAA